MIAACKKLQLHWQNQGGVIRPSGAHCGQIAAIEKRYSLRLPQQFRNYLETTVPQAEYCGMDDEYFEWWPTARIKNIPDEYPHPLCNDIIAGQSEKYLFFADYLIWCWAWAISCTQDANRGKVALINGLTDQFVADNFDDFVNKYVNNPEELG